MKYLHILLIILFVFSGCRSESSVLADTISDQTIQYHIEENQYAVVVVEDKISETEAKGHALKKAAEIAKENGYQYFKIESEGEVMVAKTEKKFPSEQSMPRNLYYELIQSGNFGRNPVTSGDEVPTGIFRGYRLIFSCYKEAPLGKSYNVCE